MTIRTIVDAAYATDGGSIYLEVLDTEGASHSVLLVQHLIPENSSPHEEFGRLSLDKNLVEIRSATELTLLEELAQAEIEASDTEQSPDSQGDRSVLGSDIQQFLDAADESPEAAIRHLVRELVSWVRSVEYEGLAHRA